MNEFKTRALVEYCYPRAILGRGGNARYSRSSNPRRRRPLENVVGRSLERTGDVSGLQVWGMGDTSVRRPVGELLMKRYGQLKFEIEPDAKWKVVILARGLPTYVHRLGKESALLALGRRSSQVTESDVDTAIEAMTASSLLLCATFTIKQLTATNPETYSSKCYWLVP